MLTHTDLKKGVKFILNQEPYEVLESSFMFKGRGSSVVQTKIKNLITGKTINKTFHPGEEFKEAEILKTKARFLYSHRENFYFSKKEDPCRFNLNQQQLGSNVQFLKPNETVEVLEFQNKIINIVLPIKINLKVIESPPGIKGDRAQAGTKTAILETGAKINVPLFIKEGDIIEVNAEKGEYVRRVEK
ncbi:MAG: elongation factor P [Candidatus Nealsonbacteria bacterium]|nr:elongation factor P [Candidatus Nealsonbacteria bacterium]